MNNYEPCGIFPNVYKLNKSRMILKYYNKKYKLMMRNRIQIENRECNVNQTNTD